MEIIIIITMSVENYMNKLMNTIELVFQLIMPLFQDRALEQMLLQKWLVHGAQMTLKQCLQI